ncbi:MAG: hypothetical protein ABI580_14070 [Burkholderiaceae bacterium]
MLQRLQRTVRDNGNVFEVLMDAVRACSLGQITNALFELDGQYRLAGSNRATCAFKANTPGEALTGRYLT